MTDKPKPRKFLLPLAAYLVVATALSVMQIDAMLGKHYQERLGKTVHQMKPLPSTSLEGE